MCRNKARMEDFIEQSQFNSTIEGVSTLSQIGAAAALNDAWDWAAAFVQHLQSNRDYAYTLLNKSTSLQPNRPEGTYVIFPKIINGLQSEAYVAEVLEKAKVAIVPGSARWFGPGAEGHVRICFSTSRDVLEEGLLRILSKMG